MADLADIEELKKAFPLARVAALQSALTRASGAFVDAVGWPVVEHEATVVLHGDGGRVLHLPAREVHTATVTLPGAEPVLAGSPGVGIRLDGRLGLLVRDDGWPRGLANITVTYTAGWPDGEIPAGVSDSVLERAGWIAMGGFSQVTAGAFSASSGGAGSGVTQTWANTVARYTVGVGDRA